MSQYSDAEAAELYNELNPWDASDDFHFALVMASPSVLDVGCGTGSALHRARTEGHTGRLAGIDPDTDALDIARRYPDIEWVEGTAASMRWKNEFRHAAMMANAFQCFITDGELRDSLAAIHRALAGGGTFAFGVRNLGARGWEGWNPDNAVEVTDADGRTVRVHHEVQSVDDDGVVTLSESTSSSGGEVLRVDRASLRFLSAAHLNRFLAEAGFDVDTQHGGWAGEPLTETSAEIVTVARKPTSTQ